MQRLRGEVARLNAELNTFRPLNRTKGIDMRRRIALLGLAVGLVAVATACGSSSSTTAPAKAHLQLRFIEKQISDGIAKQMGTRPAKVDCIEISTVKGSCIATYPDKTRDFVSLECSSQSIDCIWRVE